MTPPETEPGTPRPRGLDADGATPGRSSVVPERPAVGFSEATRFWAWLGCVSFGGPAGQIALMHRELVDERRWISEERFLHALGLCMLLPGPEAQQLATYVGWLLHGNLGGIVAGTLFVLPSVVVLLALSWAYAAWGELPAVAAAFRGLQPAVVALVAEALQRISGRALRRPVHVAIAAVSFVAIHLLGVPFPAIVLAAGLLGAFLHATRPDWLVKDPPKPRSGTVAGGASSLQPSATAVRDDLPPPDHAHPSGRRTRRLLAAFALLWGLPYLAVSLGLGGRSLQAVAYRFFTQAAFVTFGGAYAVLGYVTRVATGSLHWLSREQAMAGLALAETTPGPLIMVLQFVAFLAGWNHPGSLGREGTAVTTALVATWTTFLPCFLFILVGAPWVERLRGNARLDAALSCVIAAVVGVILELGVTFATAMVFPASGPSPDGLSALLAVAAFLALSRLHLHVVAVLAAGAAVGLVRLLSGW
ncbi:MAG: chromate efflux transporter [Alphaproteobacteria bacterium]